MTKEEKDQIVNLLNKLVAATQKRYQDNIKLIQDDYINEVNAYMNSVKIEEPKDPASDSH